MVSYNYTDKECRVESLYPRTPGTGNYYKNIWKRFQHQYKKIMPQPFPEVETHANDHQ